MDTDNTPRSGPIRDTGAGSDTFGVAQTIAPTPASRRRPSGRVDFPGGVTLVNPESRGTTPIHVHGLGFISPGVAGTLAGSLAGALVELAAQQAREAQR